MPYYRLYFFDGPGGRIGSVAEFEVHGDPHALATAEAGRRHSARQELWCGGRMVGSWPSLPSTSPIVQDRGFQGKAA